MDSVKNDFDMKSARRATRSILFAFGLGISSWAPMIPFAKTRLDINEAQLGLILLVFGIGALLSMPLSGWAVSRFGSRLSTLVSALLVIPLLPLLTIANTSFALSIVLFLFGAVTGALNVSINAQAVTVETKSKMSLMSGFHCLFSSGGLLGAIMGGVLLELNFSLQFYALTVAFIMAVILFFEWKNLLPLSEDHRLENSHKVFAFPDNKILILGLVCFISFIAEGAMLDWSAVFLHSSRHYDVALAGIGYALFSIAMAFGRLIGDKLIRRFGSVTIFQAGCLIAASGFLTIVNIKWGYGELFGFCLIGLGASNVVPILFSAAGKVSTASSSYSLTIVTTMGYIGLLIGPAFIGFIAAATTLSFAFVGVAVLLMIVGLNGRRVIFAPELTAQAF